MHKQSEPIDERALSKLRWRCRRGMLENDLFIERFFSRHADCITTGQAQGLLVLMDLADNDLLDLLLGRTQPEGELLQAEVVEVLCQMRTPAPTSGSAFEKADTNPSSPLFNQPTNQDRQ